MHKRRDGAGYGGIPRFSIRSHRRGRGIDFGAEGGWQEHSDVPREDVGKLQGIRRKGDKANKKRMACVGAAYTIQPFVREAEDGVEDLHRQELKEERPQPLHKRMRAELTREIEGEEVNGKDRIFRWFREMAATRIPDGEKAVVCLIDGERAL